MLLQGKCARAFVVSATRAAAAAIEQAGRTRYARARSYYTRPSCGAHRNALACPAWLAGGADAHWTLEGAREYERSFSLYVLQSVLTGAA